MFASANTPDALYRECEQSGQYSKYQLRQIYAAIEHGLSIDKIHIIATPAFNEWQMCQIRVGFEVGIDANTYAIPTLTWQEMRKEYERLCAEKHRLNDKIKQAETHKPDPFEKASKMQTLLR